MNRYPFGRYGRLHGRAQKGESKRVKVARKSAMKLYRSMSARLCKPDSDSGVVPVRTETESIARELHQRLRGPGVCDQHALRR